MKKLKKIIIFLIVIIVLVSACSYIDYYIAKMNNTSPKIAIKDEIDENTTVYKCVLYKVWYCKTNDTYTFGSYSDKDAICPKDYKYESGYYTNDLGIKISKRDLQLLTNDGVYTNDMIENMNSESQVRSAVHVAYNYGKSKYKILESKSNNNKIVIFPEFKEQNGNYKWIYEEESQLYCLKDKEVAIYDNEKCGTYEKIKMDEQWCSNYETSTLIYEDGINELCEE